MSDIMFACIHNAGRSQMAAAFFNKHKTNPTIKGISAGTNPATEVHPVVREIMMEVGIDLANITPVKLTTELAHTVSTIVTMGCGETCPIVPGVKIIDWAITDPKNKPVEEARVIRDEIEQRIKDFIAENNY
jgi:protein-tyrosine-phosphatase